jgi:hypothetical protein
VRALTIQPPTTNLSAHRPEFLEETTPGPSPLLFLGGGWERFRIGTDTGRAMRMMMMLLLLLLLLMMMMMMMTTIMTMRKTTTATATTRTTTHLGRLAATTVGFIVIDAASRSRGDGERPAVRLRVWVLELGV